MKVRETIKDYEENDPKNLYETRSDGDAPVLTIE